MGPIDLEWPKTISENDGNFTSKVSPFESQNKFESKIFFLLTFFLLYSFEDRSILRLIQNYGSKFCVLLYLLPEPVSYKVTYF